LALIDKILDFSDQFGMLPPSGTVLAAVSGGADSMCLLTALRQISVIRKFNVEAVHYNHMLRGEESDRDEAFVAGCCKAMGVICHTGRGDVKVEAAKSRRGIEETARIMRYSFFYETAREIGVPDRRDGAYDYDVGAPDCENRLVKIATAHTADDNAETMIMNLTRGTGTSGLAGIPPVRGAIIRPMLLVSRDEVIGFLKSMGVEYVDDSSNSLMLYTRNRIRSMVIPVLKEINPAFTDAASTAAMLCRDDDAFLSQLADEFLASQERYDQANTENTVNTVSITALHALPGAISGRVVRKLYGGALSFSHVRAVLELCSSKDPSARLSLPGMTVYRQYDMIVFVKNEVQHSCKHYTSHTDAQTDEHSASQVGSQTSEHSASQVGSQAAEHSASHADVQTAEHPASHTAPQTARYTDGFDVIPLEIGTTTTISKAGFKVTCNSVICDDTINKSLTTFVFKNADLYGTIAVRPRREADSIRLLGRVGTKTLKKLFIENRIPARMRAFTPVVTDDLGVLAICGIGRGDRAVPQPGDSALEIIFERISSTYF